LCDDPRVKVLVLAGLVGCFHPTPPEGAACAANQDCPSPLHCYGGVCLSHPPDGRNGAIDADLSCTCSGSNTLSCSGQLTACPAGCTTNNGVSRCLEVVPSNGVTPMFPTGGQTSINTLTTFDTDTGAISGGITRTAGEGVASGIGFQTQGGPGTPLGVFSFAKLSVTSSGVVHFTGSRAAVFVVEGIATISGEVDGSASCYGADPKCPGPGGGTGGSFTVAAGGCGGGMVGVHDTTSNADSGGGGGGGGGDGAKGGDDVTSVMTIHGGAGGTTCVKATLEPLVGGSGGAAGGPGATASPYGGGGGGALQLTAFDTIKITGTFNFGGAGGMPGATNANNAGAGCGGGAGGGVLLEAPNVIITGGIVAANGGGGGGGAALMNAGAAGQNGRASASPALGGTGGGAGGSGGNGGAGMVPATAGGNGANQNAGGGGGGFGVIYIRSQTSSLNNATISPMQGEGSLRTQ
jgi:hypothetical protein